MRFIKAVKIFDGERFLEPGTVLVYGGNGTLENITDDSAIPADKTEWFEGILTPGFINAHCHLELSHLKSIVAKGTGFCAFAIDLMEKRGKFQAEQIAEAMVNAEKEMIANGIVAVGDISNNESSAEVKREKHIHYHTFVELIGLNPSSARAIFEKGLLLEDQLRKLGLACSLAPHAPYSVSNELIRLISTHNQKNKLPLSIHNQESIEEHLFFMGQRSRVHDLYQHLNLNIDFFVPPRASSLSSYLPYLTGEKNILVHNTFTSADDMRPAEKKNVFWCFCPGANLYIENRLPDFSQFVHAPSQMCIGTDSLASNHQLNVLAELNLVAETLPPAKEETLLAMVCYNGARALGIEAEYGKLRPGKNAGLNLVKNNGNKFELINKVL